jgi:hypothetical protein
VKPSSKPQDKTSPSSLTGSGGQTSSAVTPPPPAVTDPAPTMPAGRRPARSDNPACGGADGVPVKRVRPDGEPDPGANRFVSASARGGHVARAAGRQAAPVPAGTARRWRAERRRARHETNDSSSAGESPRTNSVSVGGSPYRQTPAARPRGTATATTPPSITLDGDSWDGEPALRPRAAAAALRACSASAGGPASMPRGFSKRARRSSSRR